MKRLGKFLRNLVERVLMRYEGASWSWGQKSWLNATVQDMRYDAPEAVRTELLRRSRYWERNSGICQRLADVFVQFTTGPNGLQMIPDSSDEDFNESARQCFERWCVAPDFQSFDTFGMMQQTMARSLFFDGEIFVHKTTDANRRPKIELIEAHRILTPSAQQLGGAEPDAKNVVDGVKINSNGTPVGYYVRSARDKNIFDLIPAAEIIHRFKRVRPGQYRGLPMLYPVINDLHDLEDLQLLEQQAARAAAEVSNVITNASGEANTSSMIRRKLNASSQDAGGNPVTKPMPQYSEITPGARVHMLKAGEKMEQYSSNRPSVATREYWDYLTAKVCAGVGISRQLVFPFSLQGTIARADLDISAGLFRTRSKIIESVCREIYLYVVGFALKYDQSLDGAPQDGSWAQVSSHPPRAPNVDVGRNSSAMLAELDAGTRTYKDVYAELGQDYRVQLPQKMKERVLIHILAARGTAMLKAAGIDDKISVDEIASMADPVEAPEPQERNTAGSPATTATP